MSKAPAAIVHADFDKGMIDRFFFLENPDPDTRHDENRAELLVGKVYTLSADKKHYGVSAVTVMDNYEMAGGTMGVTLQLEGKFGLEGNTRDIPVEAFKEAMLQEIQERKTDKQHLVYKVSGSMSDRELSRGHMGGQRTIENTDKSYLLPVSVDSNEADFNRYLDEHAIAVAQPQATVQGGGDIKKILDHDAVKGI